MGKTEKLVVLSVLFLVVVLFVWSLQGGSDESGNAEGGTFAAEPNQNNTGGERAGGSSSTTRREPSGTQKPDPGRAGAGLPLSGPNSRDERDSQLAAANRISVKERDAAAAKLLFAEMGARGEGTAGERRGPVRMQPGWDLVTTAGLEATLDPAMFVVKPADGATWESLARDLYGDESKADLLRHNNEGMDLPVNSVFVPARDELGRQASVREVEVLKGESLWGVATRTLGNGARWKEIYEANRDVISDPNFVSPGTRLRVPE